MSSTNNIEILSHVELVQYTHVMLAHLSNLTETKNIKFTFDPISRELINAELIEVPRTHSL